MEHLTTGTPLDPEIARRIVRAERITEAIRQTHDLLADIGVPAIRALRDGEDD